jgi:hypothetical protein
MTPNELAAIKARADAAMKGPWRIRREWTRNAAAYVDRVVHQDGKFICGGAAHTVSGVPKAKLTDAPSPELMFIAHVREDVPALLREVERLQGELTTRESNGKVNDTIVTEAMEYAVEAWSSARSMIDRVPIVGNPIDRMDAAIRRIHGILRQVNPSFGETNDQQRTGSD